MNSPTVSSLNGDPGFRLMPRKGDEMNVQLKQIAQIRAERGHCPFAHFRLSAWVWAFCWEGR